MCSIESKAVRAVPPVAEGTERPFWSVMIPTYNCDELFEQTLRCVLDQDPGVDRMQIAVVDDRSPNGRSREIVARLAPDRVEFYEQPSNVGLAGNWNTCIDRARGRWVHILHQDDLLMPGFYERLGRANEGCPEAGAAFCRFAFIDAQGERIKDSPPEQEHAGVVDGWADLIAVEIRIQCPAIVVKREVYERLGGFRADLRLTLDWEMWARIAFQYPVWYEPEILASWRMHEGSETQRLRDAGVILGDIDRGIEAISEHAPSSKRAYIRHEATRRSRWWVSEEAGRLMGGGKPWRALMLINQSYRLESPSRRIVTLLGYSRWAAKVWLRQLTSRPSRAVPIEQENNAHG